MTTDPRMGHGRRRVRRPRWLSILFVALLVVPLLEIVVIIEVGRTIGGWLTFFLLLVWSALGAYLVRREGSHVWKALRAALQSGQMPARELADAALVLIGGALLLAPGFITDIVGLFLVLPFTRPAGRRLLQASITRQLLRQTGLANWRPPGGPGATPGQRPPGEETIEGEIL